MCPAGFTGTTCGQTTDVCSTIQCLNGGTCLNYGTFGLCNCLKAYTGDRCQYVNQCYPKSPCLYGGTCISVLNSFSCQCPAGQTGTTCQLLFDNPCAGQYQCLNGGTCIILSGTTIASCVCPGNFTGKNCEQGQLEILPLAFEIMNRLLLDLSSLSIKTTPSTSVLTIVSNSSPTIIGMTSSSYLNTTSAPYSCDDISLACLAYSAYCSRDIEFSGIPCRVLCPRTCNSCKFKIICDHIFF